MNRATPLTGGLAHLQSKESDISVRTILIHAKEAKTELTSRFFPSTDKLTKGTAAPIFLRMNWEASARIKALHDLRSKNLMEKSLDEFDPTEVESRFPINLTEARRAAFRERAGWEYPIDEEPLASILLPDAQESRAYNHVLLLKARCHVKHGEFAEAEDLICIAMGLAMHIGETPFVVTRLVQLSQSASALSIVEELIQQPGAPNYYWDLTSLPRPLIDARTAIQLESSMYEKTIPELMRLDEIKTQEQWNEVAAKVIEQIVNTGGSNDHLFPKPGTPEAEQALKDWTTLSRERLPKIAANLAERIPTMCDAEVGVRYWWLRVQSRASSHLAISLLEPDQSIRRNFESIERLNQDASDELPVKAVSGLFSGSFVAATAMCDQRIALLRGIESLRHHVATNAGRFPTSLPDLELPIPTDCISGQPFEYKLSADGKTATLSGAVIQYPPAPVTGGELPKKGTIRGTRYELKIVTSQ